MSDFMTPSRVHAAGRMWQVIVVLGVLFWGTAHGVQAALPEFELQEARLQGLGADKTVKLPHMLDSSDFAPIGSTVRYTLLVHLAALPDKPVGVYVRKMSLSGAVHVNGQLFEACERGALKEVRCLHRPYLFAIPPSFWKLGLNELRIDVYANARQSNGLSSVWVGDVDVLDSRFYRWRYWLHVDLMTGLTWLSALLGMMALGVSGVLRKDPVYLWFGLTSLVNALASGSVLMARPPIDSEWGSWLVFSSRFASGHLLVLMFALFFGKLNPWVARSVLVYTVVSVVAIGVSGNDRFVVTVLYFPLLLIVLMMPGLTLYWSLKTRHIRQFAATALMGLVTLASAFDWFRFTGESAFVGMYFIPYAYNGVLFMFGGLLLTILAQAMLQNQRFSADLEDKVAQRTTELERAHARMLSIETERASSMERASLLQDMHDGFGSQLVVAKMMIERQKMTQTDLAQLIQETIDDLHLMVDTLGNSSDYLPNALIDFQFRTQQRMVGSKLQLHWRLELERAPEVSPKAVLQILRIMQEALNNAFKHAQATNIWIEAVCDASQTLLHVAISDDGVGAGSPDRRVIGRGQKNMSTRARLLGAELAVVDRGPGTLVRLVVPLRVLSVFGQEQTNKMSG